MKASKIVLALVVCGIATAQAKVRQEKISEDRKAALGTCTEYRKGDSDLSYLQDANRRQTEPERLQLRLSIIKDESGSSARLVSELVTGRFDPRKGAPGLLPLAKTRALWRDKPLTLDSKSKKGLHLSGDDGAELALAYDDFDRNMDPLDPGMFMLLDHDRDAFSGTMTVERKGVKKQVDVRCAIDRESLAGLDDEKLKAIKTAEAANSKKKIQAPKADDEGKSKGKISKQASNMTSKEMTKTKSTPR